MMAEIGLKLIKKELLSISSFTYMPKMDVGGQILLQGPDRNTQVKLNQQSG